MELRYYQEDAIADLWKYLKYYKDDPLKCPVIELPTGSGKSPVMAKIADTVLGWGMRVMVVAHRKELVLQNAEKIAAFRPGEDVGIYSAGLNRKDRDKRLTFAGIQSVYNRACEIGPIDMVLFDECHLIPDTGDNDSGMYQTFVKDLRTVNPDVRLVGLTATAYRLGTGAICSPGSGNIFSEVIYRVGIQELIEQGFLSPLRSRLGIRHDWSGVHVRGGEFVASEVASAASQVVEQAVESMVSITEGRNSILVFACGVTHADLIASYLKNVHDEQVEVVTGETPASQREAILRDFKNGELKWVVGVDVLTTGFDAPRVDCVAMLRPTMSPGLYYQMVGRGFRIHPGKEDCLVLDYAGNIDRHGPVDEIRIGEKPKKNPEPGDAPHKACPECGYYTHASARECPDCEYEFPFEEKARHDAQPGDVPVLGGEQVYSPIQRHEVIDCHWFPHTKRDAEPGAPKTLRVEYVLDNTRVAKEWVCVEHQDGSFAREKAFEWWRIHSFEPMPDSAIEASVLGSFGGIGIPDWIEIDESGDFPEITGRGPIVIPEVEEESRQKLRAIKIARSSNGASGAPSALALDILPF